MVVYGHCTVDQIQLGSDAYNQIGGSACYAAAMARQFGFSARMVTRFGPDFPKQYFGDQGIEYASNALSESMTTKFVLNIVGSERTLQLEHVCEDISYESVPDADCTIVSPLYGEITKETYSQIKKNTGGFLLVDPQGFLRIQNDNDTNDSKGNISLHKTTLDLTDVQAIKTSAEEAHNLTDGESGEKAMIALQKQGVENVLYTDKTEISLLNKDKIYTITLPNKNIHDTTGVGDIFCAAFCCTMIKERDILWALCFAGGAAQAALDSKHIGVQKIPRKSQVQVNASYFYNMIKFKTV